MEERIEIAYIQDIKNSCISAIGELIDLASSSEKWSTKDTCMNVIEELLNIYNKVDELEFNLTHFREKKE